MQSLKPKNRKVNFPININESSCKYISVACNKMSPLDTNFFPSSFSLSKKLPSAISSTLNASFTALSLILLHNETSKYPMISTNTVVSRIDDGPHEILMGIDSGLFDYSAPLTNFSDINAILREENSSVVDDGVKWEVYSEKDDIAQSNYEYYDESGLVNADDNSIWTKIIKTTDFSTSRPSTVPIMTILTDISKTEKETMTTVHDEMKSINIIKCYVRVCDQIHNEFNENNWEKKIHINTRGKKMKYQSLTCM